MLLHFWQMKQTSCRYTSVLLGHSFPWKMDFRIFKEISFYKMQLAFPFFKNPIVFKSSVVLHLIQKTLCFLRHSRPYLTFARYYSFRLLFGDFQYDFFSFSFLSFFFNELGPLLSFIEAKPQLSFNASVLKDVTDISAIWSLLLWKAGFAIFQGKFPLRKTTPSSLYLQSNDF